MSTYTCQGNSVGFLLCLAAAGFGITFPVQAALAKATSPNIGGWRFGHANQLQFGNTRSHPLGLGTLSRPRAFKAKSPCKATFGDVAKPLSSKPLGRGFGVRFGWKADVRVHASDSTCRSVASFIARTNFLKAAASAASRRRLMSADPVTTPAAPAASPCLT